MHSPTSRRGVAALIALALPLAACGSSSSGSNSSASAAGQPVSNTTNQALAFAQCMRSHGVTNFPDPTSNGHGGIQIQASQRAGSGGSLTVNGAAVNGPAFKSAMQMCRKYLPNGGQPTAAQTAKAKAEALAMARCMRAHGVPNFPDPTFQSGPGGGTLFRFGGPGSGIDPNSPSFQAAQKICQPLFAGGPVKN